MNQTEAPMQVSVEAESYQDFEEGEDFEIEVAVTVPITVTYKATLTITANSRDEALELIAKCTDLSDLAISGRISDETVFTADRPVYTSYMRDIREISVFDLEGNLPDTIDGKPISTNSSGFRSAR